ncbi:hypothetical protein PG994_003594 [Apiospora phragmitis]|uniref:Transcription factor domain-containing protein n=1 Tax=Apiospora phragmitis TaxID=2905665 RepID=A0ABR1VYL3_9PEZI
MSYKALAPRPAYGHLCPDPTSPPHLKKKPTPKIACETCRTRKTAVLRDLKAAPEPLAYLASARGELETLQGRRSSTDTSVAGSLHSLSRVDLGFDELTARYQIAYPALSPIPLATIDPQPRFTIPIFKTGLDQQHFLDAEGSFSSSPATLLQGQTGSTDPLGSLTAALNRRLGSFHQLASAPSPRPARPPSYIDERLHRLQIDYWTSVPISNDFAATVISSYLEVDHPVYAFFDADLFLHDLVHLEITFCSPFLVSSLLSQACYTCAAIDSRASALGHAFFQEAETLYRAERMLDRLPNSSALAIFSSVCRLQCHEDLALETRQLSRQIGERIKLFGVTDEKGHRDHFNNMPSYMKVASAQAAWGLYNWLSMHTLFYEEQAIEYPPILPIPGEHHENRRGTAVNYDWPAHSLPHWMGCAFPALCTLWALAQEIAAVYSIDRQKPLAERVSLAFAESKYTKLLEWAATLGPELQRLEQGTSSNTLFFHMYLHTIILTLFRPFLQGPQRHQKLRVFTSADSSPSAIYEASINQMKHIVLQHLDSRHSGKLFSCFAYAGYVQLGSAIAGAGSGANIASMTKSQRLEQRLYFDICMCFFQDAYLQHALAMPIAQGLLYMALESRLIRAAKARKILQQFRERGKQQHSSLPGTKTTSSTTWATARTQIVVNFELAVVNMGAARAHKLVSQLEDLVPIRRVY